MHIRPQSRWWPLSQKKPSEFEALITPANREEPLEEKEGETSFPPELTQPSLSQGKRKITLHSIEWQPYPIRDYLQHRIDFPAAARYEACAPLVCVGGLGGTAYGAYGQCISQLREKVPHETVLLNLSPDIGNPKSFRHKTATDYVSYLREQIISLERPVILMAFSTGALTSLLLLRQLDAEKTLSRHIAAVLLIGTPFELRNPWKVRGITTLKLFHQWFPSLFAEGALSLGTGPEDPSFPLIHADPEIPVPLTSILELTKLQHEWRSGAEHLKDIFSRTGIPVHALHGTKDRYTSWEQASKALDLLGIPGTLLEGHHNLMRSSEETFLTNWDTFIEQIRSRTPGLFEPQQEPSPTTPLEGKPSVSASWWSRVIESVRQWGKGWKIRTHP